MSQSLKLALLVAGAAGAWFAATRETDVPQTQGSVQERIERPAPPAEPGALTPESWRATQAPPAEETTKS